MCRPDLWAGYTHPLSCRGSGTLRTKCDQGGEALLPVTLPLVTDTGNVGHGRCGSSPVSGLDRQVARNPRRPAILSSGPCLPPGRASIRPYPRSSPPLVLDCSSKPLDPLAAWIFNLLLLPGVGKVAWGRRPAPRDLGRPWPSLHSFPLTSLKFVLGRLCTSLHPCDAIVLPFSCALSIIG